MKGREIEKIAKDIRRSIGRTYKYKQSDYINWKIKDGYFFCVDTSLYYDTKTHFMVPELCVKPVYMDDLYWKIIYPNHEMKLPDSRRGNGVLSNLNEKIWERKTPKYLNAEFKVEEFEQIMSDIYLNAEQEICVFLEKYPNPDLFGKFLAANGCGGTLSKILVLINEGNFAEAAQLSKERLDSGRGVTITYVIGEGENRQEKSEFEYILEYCQSKIAESD